MSDSYVHPNPDSSIPETTSKLKKHPLLRTSKITLSVEARTTPTYTHELYVNPSFILLLPAKPHSKLSSQALTGVSMKIQLQTLTMPFLVPSIKYPYSGEPRSPVCFPGSLYVQSRSGGRAGGRVMKTSRIVSSHARHLFRQISSFRWPLEIASKTYNERLTRCELDLFGRNVALHSSNASRY